MKSIIPSSGHASDLNFDLLATSEDCVQALLWLTEVIDDMAGQIAARGHDDGVWFKKISAAIRHAKHSRRKVMQLWIELTGGGLCVAVIRGLNALDPEVLAKLEARIEQANPALKGDFALLLKATAS